jgi:hypothetical protein
MWILFGNNDTRCLNMHNLDTQLNTCKIIFESINGTGTWKKETPVDVIKDDYNDFTPPKWWGTWMVVGNGASTDGMFYHPNTGQVVAGSQYKRTNYVWKLPDRDGLKDMLLWFIYDYKNWVSNEDNWSKYDTGLTDSDKNYGIGHHGNTWASIWLQAIARISGKFYNDTENKWYHHSVLCGIEQDTVLYSKTADLTAKNKVACPASQFYATMANALNAMKYYDRYYGQNNGDKYGQILGFHRAENGETTGSPPIAVFTKDSGAMWTESFHTTSDTSNSYFCQSPGDLENFIVWACGKAATASLYYFFNTWSNSYATWTKSETADSSGVITTTWSPSQAIRLSLARLYNSYANKTFTMPLVKEPACGIVDESSEIPNQAKANAKTP